MKPFTKLLASLSRPLTLIALVLSLLGSAVSATPALAATFTVTKTADTNDGVCDADCSLREAIRAANVSAGADTITLPAGTYLLTLANAGGVNEDNNATGDLDVLDSLTINGAGSGTTIIQAGTNTSNGIDKVLALNPICTSAINVTITGITVRFGRNSQPSGAADFSFTGGGIDWCSAGSGGTFTLSNSVVSDNTNVNGYGGGLNVDTVSSPTTVNITNVTFSNNQTLSTTQTANGGAINLFGDSPTVTITNSTFTGNHTTNPTSGGGAIYFRPTTVGSLSISGSTFTNNTAAGIGGAIATDAHGAGTTVTIGTSTFTGNTATNSFGGALDLDATNVNTTPFSLTHLTITGNTAGQAGGGLFVGNSNVTMSKSLIVGNNAPTASGLRKSVDATTATVTNNWWGCSTGPGAAPCDTASTAGGTLNFTPWYRDQLTASTSPIVTNQSTSLTASFLTNSANAAVPVADLAEIIGRSVSWAATNGNLSGTQGAVQAAGTATGSFQATSAGTAIISAKVDNDNTSPVSANVLSLTVNKANTTTTITSDTPDPTVTGQPVAVNFSVTGALGNSPTAPTGNVTVSDGTDSCIGTVAAGTCNITITSAGSKSLTATYVGDSNFNGSTSAGVSHTVNKANTTTTITSDMPDPSATGQPVTVQFSVVAVTPGSGTPTGNVTVGDGTDSCTSTVAAGQCTITFTSIGTKSLTSTYAGDSNFNSSTSAAQPHTVNPVATAVTSITRNDNNPTNANSVTWTVVFANALSGLTASNFSLINTGLGGAPAISAVTPVGGVPTTTWTVAASTGTGNGTLGLNLANDSGLDLALTNLPFTGQAYTIDRTAPTVTIDQASGQTDPTDSVPINFTVVFDEPVTGFGNGDVTLSGTAGAANALVTGSGTTYNVAVSGITSIGTVVVSIAAGVANDAAGNGNVASTSADNTVTVSSIPKWHISMPLIKAP